MFVTSERGGGNLSAWPSAGGQTGVAAGDRIWQTLAKAAGLASAGSPVFKAWLSSAAETASAHVGAGGYWSRTDGFLVARGKDDLIGGRLLNAIHVTELGTVVANANDALAWTGTLVNGQASASTCTDGSVTTGPGLAGYANAVSSVRTQGTAMLCSDMLRVICFSDIDSDVLFVDGFDGPP